MTALVRDGLKPARFRMAAVILLCAGLVLASLSCRPAPPPRTREELVQLAERFVGLIAAGRHSEAAGMMTRTMRAAMPEAELATLWSGLVSQLGAYRSAPQTRYAEEAGFQVVYVTAAFATAELELKVVFDRAGLVTGLWLGRPRPTGTGSYSPPPYADPSRFVETERVIESGAWRLPATLSVPAGSGPFPAVVLVHGSGPQDRNVSIGPNRPFQDLAWGLASNGIVVLRYDKRTLAYQAQLQAADLRAFTVDQETVDDAVAAVALLRSLTGQVDPNRVFVLGHSLGGMMAPRIAARLAAGPGGAPAGLILLAAPARDLLQLVVEQSEHLAGLDGTVSAAEAEQLRQLGAQVSSARQGTLRPGEVVLGAHQAYWTDLLAYNQVEVAQGLAVRMLILQGERDYQVPMGDFGRWKQALAGRPGVTFRSFPALNHLFMAGEGTPTPAEYDRAANVAPEVVEQIAAWIAGRPALH